MINTWVVWTVFFGVVALIYRKSIAENIALLKADGKKWRKEMWKSWGEPLLIAGILALIIRTFLFAPYKIPTGSMIPTFMIGDKIFVNKIDYRLNEPKRGDIIVFKYPVDGSKDYVKRLVGLPGETLEIRNGSLLIDGKPLTEEPFSDVFYYNADRWQWNYGKSGDVITIPPNSYFALGDNSKSSSDSRNWGFVPEKNLIGKASLIWWPPNRIQVLESKD